jgi:hypothetical protein
MSIGISMVILADEGSPDMDLLAAFLKESYPEHQEIQGVKEKENTIAFALGQADVVLGIMGGPFPWSDLEGPCATSILWRNAADEIQGHKSHVIVTVAGSIEPAELSKLLTQVTASVLVACSKAIGVYWVNATLVVPKNLFIEFATKILPKGPPVHIWVDTRVGRQDKHSAGFTAGLDALGHMEIETDASPEEPGALRERLYLVAEYVLSSGRSIGDGDTIGEDSGEKIKVVYSDSAFGHKKKVMKLVYEKPSAKSKWKLW